MEAFPQADIEELGQALFDSATDLGAVGDDFTYGNGLLNVESAYRALAGIECVDTDFDGFYDIADCATPVDCAPTDPSVYPGAQELCSDGIDNNCDNLIDGEDPGCATSSEGGGGGASAGTVAERWRG